jgi:enoyl-CoA hydratase/carnithine racemase
MNRELFTGQELRDQGIRRATRRPAVASLIEACRQWALHYAQNHGSVSINDVRRVCDLSVLPPAAIGAIFRDKRFQQCGTTLAEHARAHARIIRVYSIREHHDA